MFCQQGGDSAVCSNKTNPKKSYGSLVNLGLQSAFFGFLRKKWGGEGCQGTNFGTCGGQTESFTE